jgi:rSAM/selenodomain-associated transferase 2
MNLPAASCGQIHNRFRFQPSLFLMKSASFVVLCIAWLADMLLLSAMGPLGRLVAASMVLYACGFLLLLVMVRFFPARLKTAHALCLILGMGLAVRAVFLFFPPNTDICRYIWEGAVQNHGFNPYITPPDDPSLAFLAKGDLAEAWQKINHKRLTAVYPPAAMLLLRTLAWISPTPIFFKAVFLLLDIGVMVVLAALLRCRQLPVSRLLFYAANPLVIVFISGEGHLDVLQVFFLCLGCFLLVKGSTAGGCLCIGFAVMAKYLSATVIPFCWRRDARWGVLSLFLPAALFIPYLSAGPALFRSLLEFGTRMHYNDFLTEVLGSIFGSGWLAADCLLLALCLGWIWLSEDDLLRGFYFASASLLVFLPTLHPWYLVMIAPFMCFFPSRAWLYLQAAVLLTFPVLGHEFRTGVFQEISWLKLPEYLPFFGLLAWGLFRRGDLAGAQTYRKPGSISVIIPTLNEAANIGRLLSDLRHRPWIREIIVSDGGSGDDTQAVARALGARVIADGKGRGVQVRSAAEAATGDVLLILHADAVLQRGAADRIIEALTADRGAAGGCFGMQFTNSNPAQRIIAVLNNFKAAVTGISFGDQAQFVRATALERIGGFPGIMLMEDVELSLRLKSVGGALYLGPGVTVSGRRWQTGYFLKNLCTVVGLFLRYLLERRLGRKPDEKWYYRKYYRSNI